MLLIVFPILAILTLGAIQWVSRIKRDYQSRALTLVSLPLYFAFLGNLAFGLKFAIGEDEFIDIISLLALLGKSVCVPLTIIAFGAMARQANFVWARPHIVVLGMSFASYYLIVYELWFLFHATFSPFCSADMANYVTWVSEVTNCNSSFVFGDYTMNFVTPTILFSGISLVFGLYAWLIINWKWLFLGCLLSIMLNIIPSALSSGVLFSLSELSLRVAIIFTAIYITQRFGNSMTMAA